jgi:hypothetical protein
MHPARQCVYCGAAEGTTRDHVPPKNLFPKPRPVDLVTVPCCRKCQRGQSLDDEYFARMVAMRHDVGDHPSAAQLLDAVHRSFTKPDKRAFSRALLRSAKISEVYSPSGLYLGRAPTYDVDLERLCRVVKRTTLGLYFDEFAARLPDSRGCLVYSLEGFSPTALQQGSQLRRVIDQALSGKARMFGNKVFTYWVQRAGAATLWAHLVYSRVAFLAFTLPSSDLTA